MDDDTISKEKYEEVVELLADKTQSNANLIAEIKELREKKQITEAEAEALRTQLATRTDAPNAQEVTPEALRELATEAAMKILSDRDVQDAKQNREDAMRAFLEKHKEFHPDNDEGGLKLSALEKKIARFNADGLKTHDDFLSLFEDAKNLVTGQSGPSDRSENAQVLPPQGGGHSGPREAADTQLTSKEMLVIERSFGGDKERYMKIKAKRPDYVAALLTYLV